MDTTTKTVLIGITALVICGFAGWVGTHVPYEDQQSLYSYTQSLAALILGVSGAWSFLIGSESLRAVFGPTKADRKKSHISDRQVRVVRQIAWTVAGSCLIIFLTQVVFLVAPVLKHQPGLTDDVGLLRGLSFGFITFLSFIEFVLLYFALRIIFQFNSILKHNKMLQERDAPIQSSRTLSAEDAARPIPGVRE